VVLRPADANEAVEAWRVAIRQTQPVCLALSRQKCRPSIARAMPPPRASPGAAYVLADAGQGRPPEVILIGTGSEVLFCIQAFEQLEREGISARVVSMPSWELFEQQDQAYRDAVLPPEISARVFGRGRLDHRLGSLCRVTGEKIGMHGSALGAELRIC